MRRPKGIRSFLRRFGLKTGIKKAFARFGLDSGMVFEGTTGVYERMQIQNGFSETFLGLVF